MKNSSLLLVLVFILTILASCGSSPYKKRKGCKGNGSWSGNRNLGAVDHNKAKTTQQMYVFSREDYITQN